MKVPPNMHTRKTRIYKMADGNLEKAVEYYLIYLASDDLLLTEDLRVMKSMR
jgi:hypothetical protein